MEIAFFCFCFDGRSWQIGLAKKQWRMGIGFRTTRFSGGYPGDWNDWSQGPICTPRSK